VVVSCFLANFYFLKKEQKFMAENQPDLSIKFNGVLQAPTILPDKQGKVSLVVTNNGTAAYQGPLDINIYASTDSVLDDHPLDTPAKYTQISTLGFTSNDPLQGTDELLGTLHIPNLDLKADQSQDVTLDFTSSDLRNPSVVAPGAYYLIAEVDKKTTLPEATENNKQASQFISTGDPVIVWNATLLNAVEASGKVLRDQDGSIIQRQSGTAPPILTRDLAITQAAIYDAVNAIDRSHNSLYVSFDASDPRVVGASPEAAVDEAAYTALVNLFPNQKATFDEQLSRSLAEIPNGTAKDKGIALGQDVANQILALRSNDGSAQQAGISFPNGTSPGQWQSTGPDYGAAQLPGWGLVTPFSSQIPERDPNNPTARLQQFGLSGPPEFNSQEFVDQENFVRQIGGFQNTDVTTITRTADQTESALFWSLDRVDTFRPTGQWNEITEQLALQKGNTLEQNAFLFSQLNLVQADTAILTWDSKYTYDQLRPISAIRQDQSISQSDAVQDPDWQPLLVYLKPEEYPNTPLTPAFPDYNSGHSAFAGAAGQVLTDFFGNDTHLDIVSQELPGVVRSYNTISAAVEDEAASRVYGGVHIPSSEVTNILPSGIELPTLVLGDSSPSLLDSSTMNKGLTSI
jgi:hypothetical protein